MARKTKKEIAVEPAFRDDNFKKTVRAIIADMMKLSNAAVALADANEQDISERQDQFRAYMQLWGHKVYLKCQHLNLYAPDDSPDELIDETMHYNCDGSRLIENLHKDFMRDVVKQ